MMMKSWTPGVTKDDWVHAGNILYTAKDYLLDGSMKFVGNNFNAETGYVPRRGYIKLNPSAGLFFFSKKRQDTFTWYKI
jgi:hypothetical protein